MTRKKNPAEKQVASRLTLKIGEAASLLGVSTSTVRRLISRGFLRPLRQLRHLLIPVEQLTALVAAESTRSDNSDRDVTVTPSGKNPKQPNC